MEGDITKLAEGSIYGLKLHETLKANKRLHVLRVPGGWLYKVFAEATLTDYYGQEWLKLLSTTFVPYDNDFCVEEVERIRKTKEGKNAAKMA